VEEFLLYLNRFANSFDCVSLYMVSILPDNIAKAGVILKDPDDLIGHKALELWTNLRDVALECEQGTYLGLVKWR
jgi:hypothetical protein